MDETAYISLRRLLFDNATTRRRQEGGGRGLGYTRLLQQTICNRRASTCVYQSRVP